MIHYRSYFAQSWTIPNAQCALSHRWRRLRLYSASLRRSGATLRLVSSKARTLTCGIHVYWLRVSRQTHAVCCTSLPGDTFDFKCYAVVHRAIESGVHQRFATRPGLSATGEGEIAGREQQNFRNSWINCAWAIAGPLFAWQMTAKMTIISHVKLIAVYIAVARDWINYWLKEPSASSEVKIRARPDLLVRPFWPPHSSCSKLERGQSRIQLRKKLLERTFLKFFLICT